MASAADETNSNGGIRYGNETYNSTSPFAVDAQKANAAYNINEINSVITALAVNGVIGIACLVGFVIFRTFMKQYQLRLHSPSITIKPPPFPATGLGRFFGWLPNVFTVSDAFVLRSAGLDALVLQKAHAIGLQMFLPLAVIGCGLLLPLQISAANDPGDQSYGQVTMASIDPGSSIMWAHWVSAFVFLGWIFMLLEYHTRQYASVRQHYLRGGDDPNYWRDLHMAEADGTHVHKGTKLLDVLGVVKYEDVLQEEQLLEAEVKQRHWWQRAMRSLTSWTGQESHERAARHKHGSNVGHVNLAHDVIQGGFTRDTRSTKKSTTTPAAAAAGGSTVSAVGAAATTAANGKPGEYQSSSSSGAAANSNNGCSVGVSHSGARSTGDDIVLYVADSSQHTVSARAGSQVNIADDAAEQGKPGGQANVPEYASISADVGRISTKQDKAARQVNGEDIGSMVAHKWWLAVEAVATSGGRMRRLTSEETAVVDVSKIMLAKPSVRYRKTVNTYDWYGRRIAVNAQQYAVLVTNVNQPCYPEFMFHKSPIPGAYTCGNLANDALPPAVKYELEGDLKGHAEATPAENSVTATTAERLEERSRQQGEAEHTADAAVVAGNHQSSEGAHVASAEGAVDAIIKQQRRQQQQEEQQPQHRNVEAGIAMVNSGKEPSQDQPNAAVSAAVAVAGPAAAANASQRSGQELWACARRHWRSGALRHLGTSQSYSLVANIFSTLFPGDFDRVVPVLNYRRVDLLMRQWDNLQGQLESARFTFAATEHRPVRSKGWFGRGEQVDVISDLETRISQMEPIILREREAALKYAMTPSWFVLFRSQKAAAIASSCNILPLNQDLFQVHPAPGPEEVNWQSLWFNHTQRVWRGWLTAPFAMIVVLLPVSLVTSAISALNSQFCAAVKWDWYCASNSGAAVVLRGLLTGFVPSLLIFLWQGLCLPRLVYMVAQSEGRHYSLSAVDRRMGEIYFYWDIFNFFIQGVLGSAAVSTAAGIAVFEQTSAFINQPEQVPSLIGQALPSSSKFFFTYLVLRTFLTVPLRFLITQPGVWQRWLRLFDVFSHNVPPRVAFMRNAIRSPRYGVEFGQLLLITLMCLAFCLISPLITLFGAAFFGGMWVFWRYQLIYNYQRKYEAGGLMWQFYVNRILICTAIMVAFTGCVMIVKKAFIQASLLWVAGFIFILAFEHRLNTRYMNAIKEMPLYLAQMAPRARVPSTTYVPPPLQANGLGWYPEFNKVWEWFGMPGYSY